MQSLSPWPQPTNLTNIIHPSIHPSIHPPTHPLKTGSFRSIPMAWMGLLLRGPAAMLLMAMLLLLGLDAASSFMAPSPCQQHHQQQQRRAATTTRQAAPPSSSTPSDSSRLHWARLQRALAPLALSVLPVLAPRPMTTPAAAAAMERQRTVLLLAAEGEAAASPIKEVGDVKALAGFGKGQGEDGERLMGRIQPVDRLTPDQEGLFKVRAYAGDMNGVGWKEIDWSVGRSIERPFTSP
jgi:hypothetical protein